MEKSTIDEMATELANAINEIKEALLIIRIHKDGKDTQSHVDTMLASAEESIRKVRAIIKGC